MDDQNEKSKGKRKKIRKRGRKRSVVHAYTCAHTQPIDN